MSPAILNPRGLGNHTSGPVGFTMTILRMADTDFYSPRCSEGRSTVPHQVGPDTDFSVGLGCHVSIPRSSEYHQRFQYETL